MLFGSAGRVQASVTGASTPELSTLEDRMGDRMGDRKEGLVHRGRSRPIAGRKQASVSGRQRPLRKYASHLFKEKWTWKMAFPEDRMLHTKLGSPYRAEQDLGSAEVFRAPLTRPAR